MGIQSSHLIKLLITCRNRTIFEVVIIDLKSIQNLIFSILIINLNKDLIFHLVKVLITSRNKTILEITIINLKGNSKFNIFNANNQLK